jgi:hypothetical protein
LYLVRHEQFMASCFPFTVGEAAHPETQEASLQVDAVHTMLAGAQVCCISIRAIVFDASSLHEQFMPSCFPFMVGLAAHPGQKRHHCRWAAKWLDAVVVSPGQHE